MSKLARLISKEEGFGIPGTQPTRKLNPGDLRHAPNASHEGEGPNDIGIEPTLAAGWADLERQLHLYASRGLTLEQMIVDYYAPANENNSAAYLKYICDGLGVNPDTSVADALEVS